MRRFTPITVRVGFVTICRFDEAPTITSPSAFHDSIDGVVRPPSWLWMTTGSCASSTATHELVVPRSMPMIRPIRSTIALLDHSGRLQRPLHESVGGIADVRPLPLGAGFVVLAEG